MDQILNRVEELVEENLKLRMFINQLTGQIADMVDINNIGSEKNRNAVRFITQSARYTNRR